MLDVATRMEADIDGFSREVVGQSDAMVGELRITAPTSFAARSSCRSWPSSPAGTRPCGST